MDVTAWLHLITTPNSWHCRVKISSTSLACIVSGNILPPFLDHAQPRSWRRKWDRGSWSREEPGAGTCHDFHSGQESPEYLHRELYCSGQNWYQELMPRGILSFYNHYFFIILHGVYGAKKPGRPGSDNNQIVVFGSRQSASLSPVSRTSSGLARIFLWILPKELLYNTCHCHHLEHLFGLTYLSCFINSCLLLLNERY